MADFNYFLNRQGPRGMQGEKGEKGNDGATPTFYAGVDSGTQYTLIIDMGDGNTFETSNLMPTFVNTGGTYLRYDTENNRYISAQADMADLQGNIGEVKLATTTSVANETVSDGDAVSYELFRQSGGGGGGTSFIPGTGLELTNANVLNVKIDNSTITTNASGQLVANGGGGSSYTAGDAIDLTGNAISVKVDGTSIGLNASNELELKATIPAAQIQSDWTQADNTKVDFIKNKPTLGSLAGKDTVDYTTDITNKPTLGSLAAKDTVDYATDVTNKPTIGAGIITFTQGSTTLGTIDVNQTTATTINIPSSGGGGGGSTYAAGNGIDISALDVISAKVDNSTIGFTAGGELELKAIIPTDTGDLTNNAGYITSSALSGYATETWVGNQGYLTGITSGDVTTALGYTPYSSANPDGYTSNIGTVTSVNNINPDSNGDVTLPIPDTTNMVTTNTTQTISGTKTFSTETHFTGNLTFDSALGTPIIRGMSGASYRNMITRSNTYTTVTAGNTSDNLILKGALTRPKYSHDSSDGGYLALYSDIPTVNDSTVSFTINGVSAGSITTNQSSGSTIALTDTQYSVMTGASAGSAGASGLVPQPAAGDNEKFLRGDGTWQTVSGGGSATDVQIDGTSITDNGVANIVTNKPISYENVSSVVYQNKNDQKPNGIIYTSYGLQIALGGTGTYYMQDENDAASAMADSSIMYAEVALNNGINIAGYLGGYAQSNSTRYVYALGKYINGDFFPIAWIGENQGTLGLVFYNSSNISGTVSSNPAVSVSSITETEPVYFSLYQDSSSSASLAWCSSTTGQKTSAQTFNSTDGDILATCTHVRVFPIKNSDYSSSDCTFEDDLKLINPVTNVTNGDEIDRMTLITNSPNLLEVSYAVTLLYDNATLDVTNGALKVKDNTFVQESSLQTVHCVIETYSNGASWYRRYDDGWVEQGGSFAATFTAGSVVNNNVAFIVPILVSNSPYSITYSLENRTNMESSEAGVNFSNITSSQFYLTTYQTSGKASSTPTCVWEAKGFEAVI